EHHTIDDMRANQAGAARDQQARVAEIHRIHSTVASLFRVRRIAPRRRHRITRAGTPATTANGGTLRVTTAPAPTMLPRPTVTPGRITALVPTSAHASIRTGLM